MSDVKMLHAVNQQDEGQSLEQLPELDPAQLANRHPYSFQNQEVLNKISLAERHLQQLVSTC